MIRSMILTRQLCFSSCCSSILILSSSFSLASSFSLHSSRNWRKILTVNSRIPSSSLLQTSRFTFRSMTTHSTNRDESNSSNSTTTNYDDDILSSTKNNIIQVQQQQEGEDEVIYNFDDETTIRTVLTETRTIAMIGASNKPHRDSYHVMEFLINECNYTVIPINPMFDGTTTTILSQKVYTSLYDVLQLYHIDMIDIFRRSSEVKDIINELIQYKQQQQQQQDNNSDNATTTTTTPMIHIPKYIWMQINVIDYESAKLAQQNGFIVIMNKCPLQEISKFNIQLPIVTKSKSKK